MVVFDLSSVNSLAHARYAASHCFKIFPSLSASKIVDLCVQRVAGGCHEGKRSVQCFTVPRRDQERPERGWNYDRETANRDYSWTVWLANRSVKMEQMISFDVFDKNWYAPDLCLEGCICVIDKIVSWTNVYILNKQKNGQTHISHFLEKCWEIVFKKFWKVKYLVTSGLSISNVGVLYDKCFYGV